MIALVKPRDLVQEISGRSEDRSLKRIDRPEIPAIHAHRGIKPRLFDHNVGQPAFFRVTADTDIKIVLQSANGCFCQRDLFMTFRKRRFGNI